MGNFKKGMVLGGLLGAGVMWLSATKEGKEMRAQLLDHSVQAYEKIRLKVLNSKTWDKLSKSEYVKTVQQMVDKYGKEFGLNPHTKEILKGILLTQWEKLQGEIQEKKAEMKQTVKRTAKKAAKRTRS